MILHLTHRYWPVQLAEQERLARAAKTWNLGNLLMVDYRNLLRDSRSISASEKVVPFVRDIIGFGIDVLPSKDDYICLTNTDTCLTVEARQLIEEETHMETPAVFSYRYDVGKAIKNPLTIKKASIVGRKIHNGADLFLFRKDWWESVESKMPDMLLGFEGWDWIMKFLIGESWPDPIIYHESHGMPYWLGKRLTSPLNLYNRALARKWVAGREEILEQWPAAKEF